jgi:hypothetical protein
LAPEFFGGGDHGFEAWSRFRFCGISTHKSLF